MATLTEMLLRRVDDNQLEMSLARLVNEVIFIDSGRKIFTSFICLVSGEKGLGATPSAKQRGRAMLLV